MRYHIHMDVKSYLIKKTRKKDYMNMFKDDEGKTMSPEQAKIALKNELAKGHILIPIGSCDNFDYIEKGCLGHEVNEEQ